MLKLLIEKELRDAFGSTKFVVTFAVSAVLVLLAFFTGAQNYHTQRSQYEAAVAESMRGMEGLTTQEYMMLRPLALLAPEPLAVLVSGVSNDIGRTTEVRGQGMLVAEGSRYSEQPIYAAFRILDLSFIFQVVLALFAILFAFDAISGEKERGTLRLSLANAVPRGTYLLGKYLGAFLAMTLALSVPLLLGCVILQVMDVPLSGADWGRLGLIVIGGMLYLGVVLGLALWVSASTQRSSTAFLVLLVCWIVGVLVWPRASVLLAGRAVEVPSRDAIMAEINRFQRQQFEESLSSLMDIIPRESGEDGPSAEAIEEFQKRQQELADAREAEGSAFRARVQEDRINRLRVQEQWALRAARLSPATTFSLASSTLAGTSLAMKERYQESTLAYQEAFDRYLREKSGSSQGGGIRIMLRSGDEDDEPEELINLQELPVFTTQPVRFGDVMGHALLDFGLLLLFNLISLAGGFVAFLRYDVR